MVVVGYGTKGSNAVETLLLKGITKDRMRAKVVKLIGEKNVERLETAWEWISTLIKEAGTSTIR